MTSLITILNSLPTLPANFHLRIENPPYMALFLEGIGRGPRGFAAISVAHYGEQNGDPMRDPEMCFEIEFAEGKVVALHPYLFQNDYTGVRQRAVWQEDSCAGNHVVIQPDVLREHQAFARMWDRNLKAQGFMRRLAEKRA
jgi:hypothetical protein